MPTWQGGQTCRLSSYPSPAGPACLWFPTLDAGCQFCEEHFLSAAVTHGLLAPPARCLSLAAVLQAHLELPRCILGDREVDYRAAAASLARFTRKRELRWAALGGLRGVVEGWQACAWSVPCCE
jgi:hypothetical protein